jgi:hypothetical protein
MLENFGTSKRDKSSGFYESQQSPHDKYWTIILLWRKRINIGHLFYYEENGSILDTYFTMEKPDQYWTPFLLWRKRIAETWFGLIF